jgi:hypothetical protein
MYLCIFSTSVLLIAGRIWESTIKMAALKNRERGKRAAFQSPVRKIFSGQVIKLLPAHMTALGQ